MGMRKGASHIDSVTIGKAAFDGVAPKECRLRQFTLFNGGLNVEPLLLLNQIFCDTKIKQGFGIVTVCFYECCQFLFR